MILSKKNDPGTVKSYIYCVNQFLREKRYKNETNNVNKNGLVCSIFVLFLIFWLLELRK